ncbi:class I SAM-dependent methyltransferase [Catellatospora sp. KI3]|uniref:class I SAM-dependent methyltransferase n=1 Tax=Catellatospora sp. KI3 TaxID=3041620 RepID=UPI002482EAE8|nr:class I SAM-dependent methyltransferase [Catellatospora sp. KI3]MDI1460659.1 class I SAM-dependent methyltransferase [Catellatospora sp. KI3]
MTDPYRTLGPGYAGRRRPDPRVAAIIDEALGEARSVVNVGAGTGSYEPTDRRVLAVEPSPVMIAQRPPGSAPVVRAVAEHLPLPDGSFDAALAVLTVHHWTDPARGLAELRRVARRQVVLTWDQSVVSRFWLVADYLPEIAEAERSLPTCDYIAQQLGPAEVRPLPVPHDCTDGFLAAYWNRPYAYLDPAVRASISSLAKLDPDRVEQAMRRLAADLDSGRWQERHGRPDEPGSADVGYRLVTSLAP